jgi:hypothetical protein
MDGTPFLQKGQRPPTLNLANRREMQCVAAVGIALELASLEHENISIPRGECTCRRRARNTSTDDDHVVVHG